MKKEQINIKNKKKIKKKKKNKIKKKCIALEEKLIAKY